MRGCAAMIDSIKIKNYQGHGSLSLDFTSGINTLVGDSDAGKSTVLRAIKWVAQNRPSGDENTKHGETDCRVMLTSQGHKATRVRTSTKNGYTLDGAEYLAIGQAVPPEVTQALQLADVNFQAQSDGWFWFSLSAGERSRELNKVVDLDSIDTALTKLAGIAKKRQTAVEVAQDRRKAAGLAVEALNHVPALQARVGHLESLEAGAVAADTKATRLRALWSTAAAAGESRRQAERVVRALESVAVAAQAAEEAASKAARLSGLRRTIDSIKLAVLPTPERVQAVVDAEVAAVAAEAKAERLRQVLATVAGIRIKSLPTDSQMQVVVDAEVAAVAAQTRADALRVTITHISGLSLELRKAAEAVIAVEAELASIPVCPTCGKPTGARDE